jgi:signal transduction histidine kinase
MGAGAAMTIGFFVVATLAVIVFYMRAQVRVQSIERARERRMREEMEAYAKLDPMALLRRAAPNSPAAHNPVEAARMLARVVCRTVADKSVFPRIAMLLRDADGKMFCAGSAGVDDLTVAALQSWGELIAAEEAAGGPIRSLTTGIGVAFGSVRVGGESFALHLGPWENFDPEINPRPQEGKRERRRFRRAIATPLRTELGRISGVLVACGEMTRQSAPLSVERAIGPIEMLAAKLAATMENLRMADRLLRAEKLAALGQLAGGVAHALNNPLTAVLGFGELIVDTTTDESVRKDAASIVLEALKMRDTVQRLIEFWRPVKVTDDPVALPALLTELAGRCSSRLSQRGVRLLVNASETTPVMRGNRDRLRQVFEHLLNNASQAVAMAPGPENGEPHTIRLNLTHDESGVHIIVSDTGTGFIDPTRVFDPFYTTRQVNEGSGLGLSICYGIIREHGGEISAFNLHPHGAAVVIELPVRQMVALEEKMSELSEFIREVA